MITRKVNSKASVQKKSSNDYPFSPVQPVLSEYLATSTTSQTVINLSFSMDQSLLSQFFLFVDGKKLTFGSSNDYTFTAIDTNNFSSQVTLTQALSANLNIQAYKLGLKKESEFGQDNRIVTINNTLALQALYPTFQTFLSGSGTYNPNFGFIVTAANATAGATYTNNSVTFTVTKTISGTTVLNATGNGVPTSSGILTKASGTGDATIQFSTFSAPKWLRVRMVGPGGGGGGSSDGTGNGSIGSASASDTTFGTLTAGKGGGGPGSSSGDINGGGGGSVTVGAGWTQIIAMSGGTGGGSSVNSVTAAFFRPTGGKGGSSFFSGGTFSSGASQVGVVANSGEGGSGAACPGTGNSRTGAGGGGGGFIEATIQPTAGQTFAYNVGPTAAAGAAGTNGLPGSPSAAGIIVVEEYFK